jgi:squalene-associated FAD-dependent desaturase
MKSWLHPPKVAVVGGGLAGLAAGCALSGVGFQVTLFERRPFLGGRASSYQHPGTGEVVDNCQHVLLGCCTNLIEFYRRIGVTDKIRWYDRLTFLEPGGRASTIGASALPAPLHTAPSFLRAPCLDFLDKLSIARAMLALAPAAPPDDGESFLSWLQRHGQTERAITRFWKTVLVSALNEDLNRISVPRAAQVIRESFLKSAPAGRMGVPRVPLTELYGAAGDYIRARGGEVKLRAAAESFHAEPAHVKVDVADGEAAFDYVVLALPFDALAKILPRTPAADPLRRMLQCFETSPIIGIHLWFDRQISDLDHAVLLDRTIQWMFHKSRLLAGNEEPYDFSWATPTMAGGDERNVKGHEVNSEGHQSQVKEQDFNRAGGGPSRSGALVPEKHAGSYVELVVSSSKSLVEKSRHQIIDLGLAELREFFPDARPASLLKSTVIKEVHATYSPQPGMEAHRPRPETTWPRVFLAGDWTATGWPATMESAVRSGYQAAESVTCIAGVGDANFLAPDLPPAGFMRLFR